MARTLTVDFCGVAPIPVGHTVEVTTFLVEEGVFKREWVPGENRPLVKDLDTGVIYGEGWHFREPSGYVSGEVLPGLPVKRRMELQEHERVRGKVTACRVAWIGQGDSSFPQTTLLVEVAP